MGEAPVFITLPRGRSPPRPLSRPRSTRSRGLTQKALVFSLSDLRTGLDAARDAGERGANPRKRGSNKEASSQICLEIPREPPFAPCLQMRRETVRSRTEKPQPERRQGRAEIRPLLVAGKAEFGGGAPTRLAGEEGQTRHPAATETSEGPGPAAGDRVAELPRRPSRLSLPTCQTTVRVIVH